jgi:salicylate hydroxylase
MKRALIIGAGIGGLTAAIALAQRGWAVHIFERSAALGDVGAGLQQSPNAMAVHQALGTAEAIKAVACEPEAAILRDYKTGKPLMTSPMVGIYEARYGHKYLHIHRADLIAILAKRAETLGVTVHFDHEVEEAQQIGEILNIIAGQRNYTGDVLIGADGIKSVLRPMISENSQPRFSRQVAWRGVVPTHQLPDDFIPFAANNWLGPRRHFVSYYIRGGTLINFVAVEERSDWASEDWNVPADKVELAQAFSGWDERVTRLIAACETPYLWGLFDHAPLKKWSQGAMTLLGDAAHPMLPFMAQGASMAIEDGWVLAACLAERPEAIPEALMRYEARRKPRTTLLQNISRRNGALYHMRAGPSRFWRNTKFKIGSQFPPAVFATLDKIYKVDVTRNDPSA